MLLFYFTQPDPGISFIIPDRAEIPYIQTEIRPVFQYTLFRGPDRLRRPASNLFDIDERRVEGKNIVMPDSGYCEPGRDKVHLITFGVWYRENTF